MAKIKVNDYVTFHCPFNIKKGTVVAIKDDNYSIKADDNVKSIWTVKVDKIIENHGKQ